MSSNDHNYFKLITQYKVDYVIGFCFLPLFLSRDGRLQESDQILAIDGTQLTSGVSHQQAIGVLQQTSGEVELIVARGGIPRSGNLSRTTSGASSMLSRTPSDVSTVSRSSVTVPVSEGLFHFHPFPPPMNV